MLLLESNKQNATAEEDQRGMRTVGIEKREIFKTSEWCK